MKKVITILLVICMCGTILGSAYAAQVGVSFTSISGRYLFADNKEQVYAADAGAKYVYGNSVNVSSYSDYELYNQNFSGSTLRFGVCVYNYNSTAATITIAAKAISYSNTPALDEVNMCAANVILPFFNGQGAGTITVPANSGVFVLYQDVPTSKTVNGKIKMKSNMSNVYARVVHGPTSTTVSQYFAITTPETGVSGQFCGTLTYTGKSASVSATVGNSFKIGEWQPSMNSNEYTGVESYKSPGSDKLGGNYGVVYNLTITNAANKKLVITPNWTGGATAARIVLYNSSIGWYTVPAITSGSWTYNLGTSSTAYLKIVIPGGNYGNLSCAFTN